MAVQYLGAVMEETVEQVNGRLEVNGIQKNSEEPRQSDHINQAQLNETIVQFWQMLRHNITKNT